VGRVLPETEKNAGFEHIAGGALSASLPADQQSKLVLVMHALPVKLDDKGAETGGFLACSVNLELATQRFMDTPTHIEVFGCERFVTRAEQLV
jgi:hypothetical protein